jgi:hypothetical protein
MAGTTAENEATTLPTIPALGNKHTLAGLAAMLAVSLDSL